MRGSFAFSAGICAAALLAAPAAAQLRCTVGEPAVRLDVSAPPPALDTMPLADLRRMSRDLGEHMQTLGLYKAELHAEMGMEFTTAAARGSACIGLRTVTIDVRLAERRIYLARELPRGSCRYETTLAHERQHARIDDTILARELPALKAAIARAAAENAAVGPFPAAELQSHRADIGERLQRAFRHEIDRVHALRRREQGAIDTPDAYRRESERCPGE
jgi:hypothetical protein